MKIAYTSSCALESLQHKAHTEYIPQRQMHGIYDSLHTNRFRLPPDSSNFHSHLDPHCEALDQPVLRRRFDGKMSAEHRYGDRQ